MSMFFTPSLRVLLLSKGRFLGIRSRDRTQSESGLRMAAKFCNCTNAKRMSTDTRRSANDTTKIPVHAT